MAIWRCRPSPTSRRAPYPEACGEDLPGSVEEVVTCAATSGVRSFRRSGRTDIPFSRCRVAPCPGFRSIG